MLLVAGIDALRRITDIEIVTGLEAGSPLEDRNALLLDGAGIDSRFVDDDIALFQRSPDLARGSQHRTKIRPPRAVDRRWNRHDKEIGCPERRRVATEA